MLVGRMCTKLGNHRVRVSEAYHIWQSSCSKAFQLWSLRYRKGSISRCLGRVLTVFDTVLQSGHPPGGSDLGAYILCVFYDVHSYHDVHLDQMGFCQLFDEACSAGTRAAGRTSARASASRARTSRCAAPGTCSGRRRRAPPASAPSAWTCARRNRPSSMLAEYSTE